MTVKNKSVDVKFNYFMPYLIKTTTKKVRNEETKRLRKVTETSEEVFDLKKWLKSVKELKVEDRTQKYNSDLVKIDEIKTDNKGYEIFHLTRLVDDNFPAIASKKEQELKDLKLEEDEYVGIDISCLYDSEHNILMAQRNFHSLGPLGIEFFISSFLEEDDSYVELRPIMYKNSFARGKNKELYKGISAKVVTGNCKPSFFSLKNPITNAVEELDGPGVSEVEILIKSKPGKNGAIEKDRAQKILTELENEKESFSRLEVKFKENANTPVEVVDLLHGKVLSILSFNRPDKTHLKSSVIQDDMVYEYSRTKGAKTKILKQLY